VTSATRTAATARMISRSLLLSRAGTNVAPRASGRFEEPWYSSSRGAGNAVRRLSHRSTGWAHSTSAGLASSSGTRTEPFRFVIATIPRRPAGSRGKRAVAAGGSWAPTA
jgi:hypothetical protein